MCPSWAHAQEMVSAHLISRSAFGLVSGVGFGFMPPGLEVRSPTHDS